jgi:tight adherence protein B
VTPWIINLLTFASVFFAVFAANAALLDLQANERQRVKKRMEEEFKAKQRDKARKATASTHDFSRIAADARAAVKDKTTLREKCEFLIDQSGVNISFQQLLACTAGLFLVFGLLGWLIGDTLAYSLRLAFIFGTVGGAIPLVYIRFKRHRRLETLRSQLPDAFELMSRVLRAGQTISQAMRSVADEFSRPIALEYLYCHEQMNLGMDPEAALRDLARRTGLLEMKIFVLAVVVQRQTGGNLAELLDKLAHVVRERFRIRGMIQSLTAQGRLQAIILFSLPPAMFLLLMILHREYEKILLEHPTLIMITLGLMITGWLWVSKIINFDF